MSDVERLRDELAYCLEEYHPLSRGLVRKLDDLIAAVRAEDADRIRRWTEDPRVKPHLLPGEAVGARRAADVVDVKPRHM